MMKAIKLIFAVFLTLLLFSCDSDFEGSYAEDGIGDATFDSDGTKDDGGSTDSGGDNNTGLITAGEWNDLENWEFWKSLMQDDTIGLQDKWGYYPEHRLSFKVSSGNRPSIDRSITLKHGESNIWKARTDNFGTAELWVGLQSSSSSISLEDIEVYIDDKLIDIDLKVYEEGINIVHVEDQEIDNNVDIVFIVDATGSMGDEINFLKDDLQDVLAKVNSSQIQLNTAAIFYRDEGDDYVVRSSGLSANIEETISFIKNQEAAGGGDYPEAVHDGLNEAINGIDWSQEARTRIAFLLLDAPPHEDGQVISSIHHSTKIAAEKGIKIIPITASGINKPTEFLMRFLAIATNGTYVFITNHSGIGNDHIEATVGDYEVEYLNNLMVRLIKKYAE